MVWCDGLKPVFFAFQNISRYLPEIAPMSYANVTTATVRLKDRLSDFALTKTNIFDMYIR